MPDALLDRLVRQHAETARLFGVDFVPAFRGRAAAAERPPAPQHVTPVNVPIAAGFERPKEATAPARPAKTDPAAAMEGLRARYEQEAPHASFVTAHTRIVWGEGDLKARLVFVGEAPGEEEDRQGRPFVGRSGQLLEKMIGAMGLSREAVYICNVLKTRPPNNATPTPREIAACEPYLREQLAILSPDAIVTLGLPAARALLKTEESMTRMRGKWRTYTLSDGRSVALMPTFHPAYVLRNYTPETRKQVWSDLSMVMEKLGLSGATSAQVTAP